MSRDGLSPNALAVLNSLIELFRQEMMPTMPPDEFRAAAYELMDEGLAKIYQDGDNFMFRLTPEGEATFGSAGIH